MFSTGNFLESRNYGNSRVNHEYQDELYNLFNKKFRFQFDNDWKLPDLESWFSTPPWKAKNLETLKNRLNFHKSQLNDFNLEEWSNHTRRRNPAGEVCWKVRCLINPEFLTQAWTKFYECACSYNIIANEAITSNKMVSLHLCEAPGAFITSLNHFLKSHYPNIHWKWLATTLNPYYEGNSSSNMISDDRFMFHTLDNWHFGVDNTGNLMDWRNSQAIINKVKSLGQILLVTADGSIDCLQEPDAQENITSPLHYCEIVTSLQALSQGGTLIYKLFTMFEHSTVSLIYLVNLLFQEVNIYKPVTSRQGNSEVYAVCIGYKGYDKLQPYIEKLKSVFGMQSYENMSLFPLETLPASFLKQIEECASYFSSIQCQVINNNLQAYLMQNSLGLHLDVKKIRAIVSAEYIRVYNLRPLPFKNEILKGVLHEECKINTNPRYHRGSYTERQSYLKMSLKQKIQNLLSFCETDILSNTLIFLNEPFKWHCFYDEELVLNIVFTYGCPLMKVNSSKFIFVPVFKLYQQIIAEDEWKEIILNSNTNKKIITSPGIHINKNLTLPDFDFKECYNNYEKRCFSSICDILRSLSLGDTISIDNFNLLTHFNVSILFILATKCFEKTGISSVGKIILSNFMSKDALKYLCTIEAECSRNKFKNDQAILNSLPVQTTNVGEFFNVIVFYNNTFYKNKCVEHMELIEQSL